MDNIYKTVVLSMLSGIFEQYKDHGFHFVIVKSDNKEFLEILTPEDLDDFEKDPSWSISHIKEFKDIPEKYYKDFAGLLREHLEYI